MHLLSHLVVFLLFLLPHTAQGNNNNILKIPLNHHKRTKLKKTTTCPTTTTQRCVSEFGLVAESISDVRGLGGGVGVVVGVGGSGEVELDGDLATKGEYFVDLVIGGQPFSVQVDTGSTLTAVPSIDCKVARSMEHCSSQLYNETKSTTSQTLNCKHCPNTTCHNDNCAFTVVYGDQSRIYGRTLRETIELGPFSANNCYFGEITLEDTPYNGPFEHGSADGIFGLAFSQTQPAYGKTLLDSILEQNKLDNKFGIEIGRNGTTSGGVLTLGGYDSTNIVGNLAFSKLTRETLYHIELNSIKVDGMTAASGGFPPAIVDSGTTQLILPTTFRTPLLKLMMRNCGPGKTNPPCLCQLNRKTCCSLTDDQLAGYPSLSFEVNGWQEHDSITLTLAPQNYMVRQPHSTVHCFYVGFQDIGLVIFGNTFMTGYYTYYDREKKRLGFGALSQDNAITLHRSPYAFFDNITPAQSVIVLLGACIAGLGLFVFALRVAMQRRRTVPGDSYLEAESPVG